MLGNPNALWLLFLVPGVLVPVILWSFWRKARALAALADRALLGRINADVSLRRQAVKTGLLVAALVSIVVALTQPKWNPRPQTLRRQGRDVCILLDTSKSMLAEDLRPNRLEQAKLAIGDLLSRLQGDRLAIVTFAGNAVVKCPLTQDYAFVRMALADLSVQSSSRGGTMIGDAIRTAVAEVFDRTSRQFKDLILITDGEDHGSFPEQAAEKAAEEGIRVIAVGLGNEDEGARIPVAGANGTKDFLRYQGQEIWSKLDGDMLRRIAFATEGGKYLLVRPGTALDLGQIYEDLIASAERRELESMTMTAYDERFQVFLALALVFLIGEVFVRERKKA